MSSRKTVYIQHPDVVGDPVPVPESSVPHWTGCGWRVVDPPVRPPRGRGLGTDLVVVDEPSTAVTAVDDPAVAAPQPADPPAPAATRPRRPRPTTQQRDQTTQED